MINIYGAYWTDSFGETPSKDWIREMSSFSPEVLNDAVSFCIHRGTRFPPNLSELIAICMACKNDLARRKEQSDASRCDRITDRGEQARQDELIAFVAVWAPIRTAAMKRGIDLTRNFEECLTRFRAGMPLGTINDYMPHNQTENGILPAQETPESRPECF